MSQVRRRPEGLGKDIHGRREVVQLRRVEECLNARRLFTSELPAPPVHSGSDRRNSRMHTQPQEGDPVLRFYTLPPDVYADYPWLLVNFFNRKKLERFRFKHAILDSGVNRIFFNWKRDDYPAWVLNRIAFVAQQLSEIYRGRLWVTIPDYPDDYYPGTVRDNIDRTLRNIERFLPVEGVEWLPVIQCRYHDIFSFYESCEEVKKLIGEDYPRIAIGTVCKSRKLSFIVNCCKIARKYFPNSHIHAFGLTLKALPKVKDYIDSWDSLAWTYPRESGGASCKNLSERQKFFYIYLKRIKMLGIEPEGIPTEHSVI